MVCFLLLPAMFISTHAPLAGRDYIYTDMWRPYNISTHAPLAGRDRGSSGRGDR